MISESIIIRPPSEAGSFLLPVTIGCSNNTCTFCGTFTHFKFQVIEVAEIKKYIDAVAIRYSAGVRRVFLENGDALIAPQATLKEVLSYLAEKFPNLNRVGTYATPRSALEKSVEELKELKKLGLSIAYLGVETGDEELLKKVQKGAARAEIIEAGRKLKQAGITTSVTVVLGLGGTEYSERHAVKTGEILTEIDPDFAGALTLMLVPGTPLYQDNQEGKFTLISPFQSLVELKQIIENSNFTNCFFTSNHASNYLPVRVRLPRQKNEILSLINDILAKKDDTLLKPEYFRAL
jgi:radical SAM superfamily enzyme YgiQ (UPF0313 family)